MKIAQYKSEATLLLWVPRKASKLLDTYYPTGVKIDKVEKIEKTSTEQ